MSIFASILRTVHYSCATIPSELRRRRKALCGGRGVDSGNVAGAALESWNGVLCGRIQCDDGTGCGFGIRR